MSQAPEDDEELRRIKDLAPLVTRATVELDDAREHLLALTIGDLSTVDAQAEQAEQSRRVWELESMVWQMKADLPKAAECSKQSVLQGKLAISFRKATLADRVTNLERALSSRQARGGKIRASARRAKE